MARTDNLSNFLTDVADAIREKKGTTGTIKASEFDNEIIGIESSSKYAPSYISFRDFTGTELEYEITNMDWSNIKSTSRMFYGCSNLTTLELLRANTGNVLQMVQMFYNCSKLISLDGLNVQKCSAVSSMFSGCSNLQNLGRLTNLGQAYPTTASANYILYTLDLSPCNSLTHDSLLNVINSLYDIKKKGCNTQKLVLGTTNKAKLSAKEIAIATNKGWTVS